MSITGYATRFGLLRLVTVFAEQAYNVAGFLLNSGKPLEGDELRRIAADVREIRALLTSAAPVPHSPRSEDAAEGPRAEPPARPGHLNVADIPCGLSKYWDCTMVAEWRRAWDAAQ